MGEDMDRRRYQRVAVHIPVKYRKLGEPDEAAKSSVLTKNISDKIVKSSFFILDLLWSEFIEFTSCKYI